MVKVKEDMTGWRMWEHGISDIRLIIKRQVEDKILTNGDHLVMWECEPDHKDRDKLNNLTDGRLSITVIINNL